jgi:ABC-type polysaccharide/polyol phosphate transport system ATPase subunit
VDLPTVTVENVSKTFRVPHQQASTLKERVLHPFRSTTFDRLEALKDISFEVAEGEFFGIVGRNGSGKSTLLKCLAGIYQPTAGQLAVTGRVATFIELGVGFNPELAARDNVLINATMLGLSRKQAAERFDDIIAFAELEQFLELRLKNYSSGMHVRLAFSTAVQLDADVLIVDEVLAVGDAAFQQKCYEEFWRMKDEGKTILFVTHDMGAVARFCDRAMLLERGEMVDLGDPTEIGRAYHELNFNRPRTLRSEDGRRHGDQREAEVTGVWFEQPVGSRAEALLTGDPVAVCVEVGARMDLPDAIFQVTLRDESHRAVFIAHSQFQEDLDSRLEGGRRYVVKLFFDCHLGPGRYEVTPALLRGESAEEIVDLRDGLASIMVHAVHSTGGVVELPHRFTVEPL